MLLKKYIFVFILLLFSIYCAISVGESWDERYELLRGKTTLDYLFSLGSINNYIPHREDNSTMYFSFSFLISQMFPIKYQIEVSHIINLVFSLGTIYGLGKIGKELFGKKIGYIAFILLFFLPSFFGHMAINSKDTIIAFSHVWIFYLVIRYLKKQTRNLETFKYVIFIAVLASLGTGIKLVFIGSLLPIVLFIFLEIFFTKRILNKNFYKTKFLYDLVFSFLIFYIVLLFFWVDVHPNIFKLPINYFLELFSSTRFMGWPFNLSNGEYFLSREVPNGYFLINLLFKLPEFIIVLYLIFIVFFFQINKFFQKNIENFKYKICFFILILLLPNFVLISTSFPAYDGIRLFLWVLPYVCLIPALTIYYLYKNLKYLHLKILSFILFILMSYFFVNFLSITPYQYTYLNILNGKKDERFKRFENDYWGVSLKKLLSNVNFKKNKFNKIATCGVNLEIVKIYLKKENITNVEYVHANNAEYIIMTNRVVKLEEKSNSLINCFEKFPGRDISVVKANGVILSRVRALN